MIVDGKTIAAQILARTKERAEKLARRPKVIALVGLETPATKSYLKIKAARAADAGCDFELRPYPSDFSDADAVIIQLPLPENTGVTEALDSIPLKKDADVLSTAAWMKFETHASDALTPPVAGTVAEILKRGAIDPAGKRVAIVGNGRLVGQPCAILLRHLGGDVIVLDSHSDLNAELKTADLIVSGAGSPHLIKPEMIKEGAVLIDAGTSESGGAVSGDADPACAAKCSLFTPVPGGVGPIAVAKLFENAVLLAERNLSF